MNTRQNVSIYNASTALNTRNHSLGYLTLTENRIQTRVTKFKHVRKHGPNMRI